MQKNIQYNETDYEKMGFLCEDTGTELLWNCPPEMGRGFLQSVRLRPGFRLLIRDLLPYESTVITFNENSLPLTFSFLISGSIANDLQQGRWKKKFLFTAGQTSLSSCSEIKGHTAHTAGEHMRMINIWITRAALKSLITTTQDNPEEITDLLSTVNRQRLHFGTTTPSVQTALFDICSCPYNGSLRRLFLESKCMELICFQLGQMGIGEARSGDTKRLTPTEIERIRHARNLLVKDLRHPPSVIELSRMVGINDYQLRLGFHKLFGTTIFEQLRRQRLVQARLLLEQHELNVAQVAHQVGYSDLKHFYQAFKKRFNTTPGACRNIIRIR